MQSNAAITVVLSPCAQRSCVSWHSLFGNLKAWLRGTFHGVSPKHLQRYLHEFVFRFNQRWHENELFSRVLLCAISAGPSPYNQLTAERSG